MPGIWKEKQNTTAVMKQDKLFIIVAYDIVKTKRRTRVMKLLKGLGFHVQKSVFELFISEDKLDWLRFRLYQEINEEYDSIRIYKIGQGNNMDIEILGIGEINEDRQLILI